MENYLTNFKENTAYKEIDSLVPENICPFLFYNLAPYIFTLTKGGWFNWVKRDKDISFRKSICKDDFKRKDVNRLYHNEVLVGCPNPYRIVVAGVGLWPKNKIKIRILHSSNLCVNNYKIGDEVVIDRTNVAIKVLGFNRIFPEILSLCIGGKLPERDEGFDKTEDEIAVEVSKIIFPCRYHKKKKKFRENFLPDKFCSHTFIALYPYILATMYAAKINEKLKIKHPGNESHIIVSLEKVHLIKNKFLKETLNLSKKLFEIIFYPVDLLDYNLEINILENELKECSLKKDKKYMVNLRDENFLCPASFHALYPYLLLATLGCRIKWNGDGIANLLPCPDCIGTVYSINRKGGNH